MATDEEILREIEADWERITDAVFKLHQQCCLDHTGKVIPEPGDYYPLSVVELLDRDIDIEAVCSQIQGGLRLEPGYKEYVGTPLEEYSSYPSNDDLRALIAEWLREDPVLQLSQGEFPWVVELLRSKRLLSIDAAQTKLMESEKALQCFSDKTFLPKTVKKNISFMGSKLEDSLRYLALYKKMLVENRPRFFLELKNETAFQEELKVNSGERVFKFSAQWKPLLNKTHDFFLKHIAKSTGQNTLRQNGQNTKQEVVSISACRMTASILKTLFPEIFTSIERNKLAEKIRTNVRDYKGIRK